MKIDKSILSLATEDNLADESEAREYKKRFKKKYGLYFKLFIVILILVFSYLLYQGSKPFDISVVLDSKKDWFFASLFFIVPFIIYQVLADIGLYKVNPEARLLERIAEANNGTFVRGKADIINEKGKIFRMGDRRYAENMLTIMSEGNKIRLFNYHYVVTDTDSNGKKNSTSYYYHVFSVETSAIFPHMYLNYKKNAFTMSAGEHLSLPLEFEKDFELSIAKGYQLEVLQVFTPDILATILNLPFKCDIEFVENKINFIMERIGNLYTNFDEFERQVNGAKTISDYLVPKIKSIRWSPVGDVPYRL